MAPLEGQVALEVLERPAGGLEIARSMANVCSGARIAPPAPEHRPRERDRMTWRRLERLTAEQRASITSALVEVASRLER